MNYNVQYETPADENPDTQPSKQELSKSEFALSNIAEGSRVKTKVAKGLTVKENFENSDPISHKAFKHSRTPNSVGFASMRANGINSTNKRSRFP